MNRTGEVLVIIGLVILGLVCAYAMAAGDIFAEGGRILDMPWGVALFVDIYLGFLLFSGWVLYRERSKVAAAIWIGFILVGGNLVTCAYVIRAFRSARGDWGRFWLGAATGRSPETGSNVDSND